MLHRKNKLMIVVAATLGITAIATPQLKEILKAGGVVALVNAFGKDINKAMNGINNHKDDGKTITKVVPIITVGIGRSSSAGAVQVMGPAAQVKKVVAVASPEAEVLGKEVRIRGLIPVSSKDVIKDIRKVDGVGISGLVELRL